MLKLHDPKTISLRGRARYSWASNILDGFIELATGKPVNTNIVVNPTTPVEKAINAAAAVVLPAAAAIPGVDQAAVTADAIKQVINDSPAPVQTPSAAAATIAETVGAGAESVVNGFLTTHVGQNGTAIADASLIALATTALSKLSSATTGNVTAEAIEAELEGVVQGFSSAAQPAA